MIMIIIIIIIIVIINPHNNIRQFHLLKSSKFSQSKKSFFLYYRQNLLNITMNFISIHASLKGNYRSILKKTI